ncbi:hypothetical protein [Defluviimonas sp. WL0075]|uniref:Lactate/malate dehydrogenase N-terminal domain-containing protein n=1 Tax=Albidovulum sediminicola TaxID=2984331 RepID=A0ABT2Z4Q2_9RHOB|nr:hypothetical protein [Defluviimonas sp. WL0075]MCV2866129.1 hypothetical protein [Defluviimonas sp. WL0075]
MAATIVFIGAGDVGLRMADGLLARAPIGRMVLADFNAAAAGPRAAMLGNCHGVRVEFRPLDGRDKSAIAALVRETRPDLIAQCASLISPWSIIGRDHPVARKISGAGIALQIGAQLPILLNVMEVLRDLGVTSPVANITMPDILHPMLAARGLAPTVGLGNVSIQHLRVRHRLVERDDFTGDEQIRVLGHHCQVYDVMKAQMPLDAEDRVRVFLGEEGARHDPLAYEGAPFPAGPIYNEITAASALPVLAALLPGAVPLRFSAPAPEGLPGGYPVRIDGGAVALDLPQGQTREDAVVYNRRQGRRDGVERIEGDGTLVYTPSVREAVRDIDPALAEPVEIDRLAERTERLMRALASIR